MNNEMKKRECRRKKAYGIRKIINAERSMTNKG